MKEIFLGEVIRQRRLELGLTQEELCEGICEPMTISRFENGKQTPSRNRISAILQRLGLPDDRFYALLSNKELEIGNLEKELVSCHVRFERAAAEDRAEIREEAFAVHRRMTELMDKDDILTRQEIMRSRFLLGKFDADYGYEEGMAMLLDAIVKGETGQLHINEDAIHNGESVEMMQMLGYMSKNLFYMVKSLASNETMEATKENSICLTSETLVRNSRIEAKIYTSNVKEFYM